MNSSETELGYIEEVVWGVTPASPAPEFQLLNIVGESLSVNRENVNSDEINPTRNVTENIQVGGDAGGSIDGEMSYGNFDDLIASALFSDWNSGTGAIVNGVTEKSFTIQRKQTRGTGTPVYSLFKGMVVNTMSLNINAKNKVTTSFTFVGKGGNVGNVVTGSNKDATTTPIFDASNAFKLTECFSLNPLPDVMTLTLNIDNELTGKPVAGSKELLHVTAGRCNVSGSASFYFKDKGMMELFLAGTGGKLEFSIGHTKTGSGKYVFNIPSTKITSANHYSPSNGEDVMLNINWQGENNSTLKGTIKITKTAGAE